MFLPVFFFEFHVEMEPRIFVKVIFLCSGCSKSKIGATSRFLFGQITNEFSCFFSLFLQILLKPFFKIFPEIDDVFPAFFSLKFQILQQKQKNGAAAVSHSFQIFQIYPKWLSIKYCRDSGWRNKISVSSITFSQSKRNSFRFNHGHLFSYFHRRSGTCVCCMAFRFDAVGNFWRDERFGQKYHIPREWKHQLM